MKKYIIFDFDGTMLNTNEIIIDSWTATYEHFLGHSLSRREIEARFGETLVRTAAETVPGVDVNETCAYYRKYQLDHCDGRVSMFEGMRELLEELRSRGCRIGLATSRTADTMWKYLREFDLGDYIDVAVTMDDVTRHKPASETVDKVLEKFGARPEEAVMLGDTKYDIGCAMNAGVDSVLVEYSHYIDEEGMATDGFVPTYRISRPEELLEII